MLQDLNDLYFFAKVVDGNGFAAAARNLGIPRSRLSWRIGLLEQRIGVRLIQRSTRHFAVTDIGREYYRHCLAVRIEAEAAQEAIDKARAEPHGTVRMSCSSPVLNFQVGEMIVCFMAKYPKVDVHLESTNRRVDVLREVSISRSVSAFRRWRRLISWLSSLQTAPSNSSPAHCFCKGLCPSSLRTSSDCRAWPGVHPNKITSGSFMGRTARPLEFLISRIS